MSNASTRISIYADDKTDGLFRRITGEAETLTAKLEAMGPRVSTVLQVLGIGAGGFAIGSFLKDSTLAAARYETLGLAMDKAGENAGYRTEQMRGFEAQLQKNGIAMQESREILARLAAANVDLSRASEMARASQDLAVVAGINSSEAFSKMVHGAVSGQLEVLRTLGLMVTFETEYAKAASQLGKSAKDLTEAEKLQARLNITLEAASKYAGIYELSMTSASKQLGTFTRHFSDFQTLVGGVALDSLAYGIFGVNDALGGVNSQLREMQQAGQLQAISKSTGEAVRLMANNVDTAAVALGAYYLASKAAKSGLVEMHLAVIRGDAVMLNSASVAVRQSQSMLTLKQATQAAALETLKKAQAEELAYASAARSVGITVQHESAYRRLIIAQRQYSAACGEVAVATSLVDAAQKKAALSSRAMAAASSGFGSLKTAGMGVVNMLGGPWVLGMTAAAGAVYYLATADSAAEKAAKSYGMTLAEMEERYKNITQGAKDAAKETANLTETYKRALEEQNHNAINAAQKQVESAKTALSKLSSDAAEGVSDSFSGLKMYGLVDPALLAEFQDIIRKLHEQGGKFADEAEVRMRNLKTKADDAASGMSGWFNAAKHQTVDFSGSIEEAVTHISALGKKSEEIDKLAAATGTLAEKAAQAAAGLLDLSNVNFQTLQANVEFEIGKVSLSDRNRAMLDGLLRDKVLGKENIKLSGGTFGLEGLTPEAEKSVNDLTAAYGLLYDKQQSTKKSGKDLTSILAGLNDELAKLTMTEQDYARYQYETKFARLRKDLGATSPALREWASLQESALNSGYASSDAMASHIRDVGKAISEMGLDDKQKQLKTFNEEMARLKASISSGVKMPFSAEQLDAYQGQRSKEITTGRTVERDKQILIDFEKEYTSVMQSSEAAQIASIRERAKEYEIAGADVVRVAQWQKEMELRYSREATDGMKLAFRDYAADATNAAKNIGGAITNTASSFENSWVNMCTTGKFQFSDFANSVIADLARITTRQTITGPIANILGSAISAWAGGGMATPTQLGQAQSMVNYTGSFAKYHSGGIAGLSSASGTATLPAALFANAPRYHSGGISGFAPDEVAAVLRRNEEVLTTSDPRHRFNLGKSGSEPGITINVYAPPGSSVETTQRREPDGGKRIDLQIAEMAAQNVMQGGVLLQSIETRLDVQRRKGV